MWKSIPPSLRGVDLEKLAQFGLDEGIGRQLIEITSRRQFAKHFNVNKDTLTEWDQKIYEAKRKGMTVPDWALNAGEEVLLSLYKNAKKNGSAAEVKAFFELTQGWSPKKDGGNGPSVVVVTPFNDGGYRSQYIQPEGNNDQD